MAWYVRAGHTVDGPLNGSKLRAMASEGLITRETLLSQSEAGPWIAARKVKGLFTTEPQCPSEVPKAQVTNSADSDGRAAKSNKLREKTPTSTASNNESGETGPARRLPAYVRLAFAWYRLSWRFWVPFYCCLCVLILAASKPQILPPPLTYMCQCIGVLATVALLGSVLLTVLLRFWVADYTLPLPHGRLFIRSKGGGVHGPYPLREINGLLGNHQSDLMSADREGPFFYSLQAFAEIASDGDSRQPFWRNVSEDYADVAWFFVDLLPQLRQYRWFRLLRFVLWCVVVDRFLSELTHGLRLPFPTDAFMGNPYLYKWYAFFAYVAIADVVLSSTSSSLGRSYITQMIARRKFQQQEAYRRANAERVRAAEAFMKSGLFDAQPRISGLLIHIEGISCRNTSTDSAEVTFQSDGALLSLPGGISRLIPQDKIKSIVVGGRGSFTTSQDSMWSGGGFGVSGAIKGALNAAAMNLVTSLLTRQDHKECIIQLKWANGEVVLLNQYYEPTQAWDEIRRVSEHYCGMQ